MKQHVNKRSADDSRLDLDDMNNANSALQLTAQESGIQFFTDFV